MKHERRCVGFAISHELLTDILRLPEGLRVAAVADDFDRMCMKVMVKPEFENSQARFLLPIVKEGELIPLKYIEYDDKRIISVTFKWWFFGYIKNVVDKIWKKYVKRTH